MKKLLLAFALLFPLSVHAEDYLQLPNPDIDIRGYIIKDTKVLEGITSQSFEYTLPVLAPDTYWTAYRVCLNTVPAFIDWDNSIYFPTDEGSRVKLTALAGETPNTAKSWQEACSPLVKLGKADSVKVTLESFRSADTVNKISIKLFNEVISLK